MARKGSKVCRRACRLVCGVTMLFALTLLVSGFGSGGSFGAFGARSAEVSYDEPNDFVYQLQNIDLDAVGKTEFDSPRPRPPPSKTAPAPRRAKW